MLLRDASPASGVNSLDKRHSPSFQHLFPARFSHGDTFVQLPLETGVCVVSPPSCDAMPLTRQVRQVERLFRQPGALALHVVANIWRKGIFPGRTDILPGMVDCRRKVSQHGRDLVIEPRTCPAAGTVLPGPCGLAAMNDVEAIAAWLGLHESAHMVRAYRREAERLVLWAVVERRLPLSSLTAGDATAFRAFLRSPVPAARWTGPPLPAHVAGVAAIRAGAHPALSRLRAVGAARPLCLAGRPALHNHQSVCRRDGPRRSPAHPIRRRARSRRARVENRTRVCRPARMRRLEATRGTPTALHAGFRLRHRVACARVRGSDARRHRGGDAWHVVDGGDR
ncbi:hypothetical protein OKW46_006886 [Paraburkholderia sp. WSM4179]|nr:hypothetical protein [Paraburkholderia sp. WSM4179]